MKTNIVQWLRFLPLLWGLWMLTPAPAQAQCPMCKAAVESGSNGGKGDDGKGSFLVRNLNTGILYLFALPYSAIMVIVFVYVRAKRRRKREEEQERLMGLGQVAGLEGAGPQTAE